jgi:hypothetical protein
MPRRFIVQIHVERVRQALSGADGIAWTADEVVAWLSNAGFSRVDDTTWLVSEADLGQVDPSEVTILREEP